MFFGLEQKMNRKEKSEKKTESKIENVFRNQWFRRKEQKDLGERAAVETRWRSVEGSEAVRGRLEEERGRSESGRERVDVGVDQGESVWEKYEKKETKKDEGS